MTISPPKILSEAGFTLLEVLVSLGIFSIAAAAIATSFTQHLAANASAETRSGAISAAQQVLDRVRVTDPTLLPTSGTSATENITIGNKTFQVQLKYCSPSTYCTSNSIRAINATARYNGAIVYTVDTVYSQLR